MIYLIRHGEAAAGWGDALDPGLSDLGHAQAKAAAKTLASLGATNIISSPMQRCRETAAAFEAVLDQTASIETAVSEIETPEGLRDRTTWLQGVMSGTWDEAGEPFVSWRQAALDAVTALPDNTAVFSHFVAINAIVSLIDGLDDVVVFKPGHCSITQLVREDGKLDIAARGSEAASKVL